MRKISEFPHTNFISSSADEAFGRVPLQTPASMTDENPSIPITWQNTTIPLSMIYNPPMIVELYSFLTPGSRQSQEVGGWPLATNVALSAAYSHSWDYERGIVFEKSGIYEVVVAGNSYMYDSDSVNVEWPLGLVTKTIILTPDSSTSDLIRPLPMEPSAIEFGNSAVRKLSRYNEQVRNYSFSQSFFFYVGELASFEVTSVALMPDIFVESENINGSGSTAFNEINCTLMVRRIADVIPH